MTRITQTTKNTVYLDNAATTKIDQRVLDIMQPYLYDEFYNPGSIYPSGVRAKNAIDEARQKVADFFNCNFEEVIFTSGGSEGNNLVINGLRRYLTLASKKHIVTSAIEHDSVLRAISLLCLNDGFQCGIAYPQNHRFIQKNDVENLLTNDTGLVSVMYINNETGAQNEVKDIAELCRNRGVIFHTDCVQAAGVIPIDVKHIGCDFATISSHKIHGPKGVGAIFAKKKSVISPIIAGGAFQEFGLRGGTENVAGIVGFGEACRLSKAELKDNSSYISNLREEFARLISELIPDAYFNCLENGKKILSITIPGIDSQSLILLLGDSVQLSAGSACNSHNDYPSHVLKAIGLSDDDARSTIRISLSAQNTSEETSVAAYHIADAVRKVKMLK